MFALNNSDGRIWAFYSTYFTLDRDIMGYALSILLENYYCSAKMVFIFSWVPYISYSNLMSIML